MERRLYVSQIVNYLTDKTGEKHVLLGSHFNVHRTAMYTADPVALVIVPERFGGCELKIVLKEKPYKCTFSFCDEAGIDVYDEAVKILLWPCDYKWDKEECVSYLTREDAQHGALRLFGVDVITSDILDDIEKQPI